MDYEMLQLNQTYIIPDLARVDIDWTFPSFSLLISFLMSMSTYQKLIKGPFFKYIELHLRVRDEPPIKSVTSKIINQIKQWTETRAIGALTPMLH